MKMLDDPSAEPIYSIVAWRSHEIIGHVLFTAVKIQPSDVSAQILAPLAVSPNQQGSGIGTKLIEESLVIMGSNGVELVFVLGYPQYYSRFGFTPAGAQGLQAPYPIPPKNADAWMVKELSHGAIESNQGTVRCCNALDAAQYWTE